MNKRYILANKSLNNQQLQNCNMGGWGIKIVLAVLLLLVLFSIAVISLKGKHIPASFFGGKELSSPSDWVKEEQIRVYENGIILDVKNASWANFTDTNSMDPLIDEQVNAIEILPEDADQINAGDIISYKTKYGIIIHRVIEKGEDEEGIYYIVKGDNNRLRDPFKVRFEDVKGVVVAIVY